MGSTGEELLHQPGVGGRVLEGVMEIDREPAERGGAGVQTKWGAYKEAHKRPGPPGGPAGSSGGWAEAWWGRTGEAGQVMKVLPATSRGRSGL